ncbi:carbohydrate ABC transporter permease [Dactylosporangium sp. CA-233914]|uniref:carbohydrate ABC transporter permease n=1 Tax=Dactylosporangium sp. CA-233914 TaxID=3239934 RepID=UPI003D935D31
MNRYTWRTRSLEGVMFVVALIFLFPIYILVNLAIRKPDDLSSPVAPTKHPTFGNFADAWNQASVGGAMANSMIITVVSVVLLVVLSSMAAYPLARLTSKWSSLAFYGFMVGLLVPFQLGLIPLYKMMRDIGLLGTIFPLIIIYVGLRIPFSLFLYTQFLRQIPLDYEEAAAIDGCSPVQAFFRVVFPLLRPVTGTVVILNGLFIWNDFLKPLLYLSGTSNQTIPVAIYTFVGEYDSQWELIFAALLLGALPVLVAFFFLQKSLIQGFSSGIKG